MTLTALKRHRSLGK
uniref:Uncharacterized protein n=1 Tax=Anguilla anguilla TaxID=7936 RepID=A0A0E9R434_ANGAN